MKTEIDKTELAELRKDKARIDWLASVDNNIAQVLLPTMIVETNLHSMRAAIDATMMIEVVE